MSTDETGPICDPDAERAALGAMLLSEHAACRIEQILSSGDLAEGRHQSIYEAIQAVRAAEGSADPLRVAAHLTAAGRITGIGGAAYLHTLTEAVPAAANGAYYARIVRDHAVRRRLIDAGRRVMQQGYAIDPQEPASAVAGAAERAVQELEAVRDFETGDEVSAQTIEEFLAVDDDDYDWIVPGLLERGDRLVLTGTEGLGKTTLFRQIAVTVAAGIHPFGGQAITPRRVLIVDVENSQTQGRRALRPLWAQARSRAEARETNLWVEVRPEGLDLAQDRDVSWLLKRVSVLAPDVVAIGPLYRLAPRALNSDDDAAPILAALNLVRARGCCLLLEAHAGHATTGAGGAGKRDLRPRGSSALMGWPEFGYGIRMSEAPHSRGGGRRVEMVSWRGDRDEREWPEELESGGTWPWSEAPPPGYTPGVSPYSAGDPR